MQFNHEKRPIPEVMEPDFFFSVLKSSDLMRKTGFARAIANC